VIDAPPLLPVTDAAVLSQSVGGVVLVVGSQRTKAQDVQKSLESLNLVGARILGLVLNRLPSKGPDAYAYGYYTRDDSDRSSVTSAFSDKSWNMDSQGNAQGRRVQTDFDSTLYSYKEAPAARFPRNDLSR
jgi:hypothetical protein